MSTPKVKPKKRREHFFLYTALIVILMLPLLFGVNKLFYEAATDAFGKLFPETEEEVVGAEPEVLPQPVNPEAIAPGQTAINQIVSAPVLGITPQVDNMGTPNSSFSWAACQTTLNPAPFYASSAYFPDTGITVVVSGLGAGQGVKGLDTLKTSVQGCSNTSLNGNFLNGFIVNAHSTGANVYTATWRVGDVIVFASGYDVNVVKNFATTYDGIATLTLRPVCVNFDESVNDAKRSPYYDQAAYTGWTRNRDVHLDINTTDALNPTLLSDTQDLSFTGLPQGNFSSHFQVPVNGHSASLLTFSKVRIPVKPEAPLGTAPTELPVEVPLPGSQPVAPTTPNTVVGIPERVFDEVGPGCGWAFSGQSAPPYDDTVEKQRVDQLVGEAQGTLQAAFATYLQERTGYVNNYVTWANSVLAYQTYAGQVNDVGNVWNDITTKRQAYREKLDQYLALKKAWDEFPGLQTAAQEQYLGELEQCRVNNIPVPTPSATPSPTPSPTPSESPSATPSPSSSASPSPTPTPTPEPTPEPVDCETVVVRPAILDQERPSEPIAPAKPNVPLPASWTDVP